MPWLNSLTDSSRNSIMQIVKMNKNRKHGLNHLRFSQIEGICGDMGKLLGRFIKKIHFSWNVKFKKFWMKFHLRNGLGSQSSETLGMTIHKFVEMITLVFLFTSTINNNTIHYNIIIIINMRISNEYWFVLYIFMVVFKVFILCDVFLMLLPLSLCDLNCVYLYLIEVYNQYFIWITLQTHWIPTHKFQHPSQN